MQDWFRTPVQKFYAALLTLLTVCFGVLSIVSSVGNGTEVFNQSYTETIFEEEEISPSNIRTFELKEDALCQISVGGPNLDQSWLWASVVILDEKDRPVHQWTFDLSYYHGYEGGESWSEGKKDDYEVFRLPKGNYRVMVHGEDEPTPVATNPYGIVAFNSGDGTVNRDEIIQVKIARGVWMTRYFVIMLILFGSLLALYCWIRSERSQYETQGLPPYDGDDDLAANPYYNPNNS